MKIRVMHTTDIDETTLRFKEHTDKHTNRLAENIHIQSSQNKYTKLHW